MTTQFIQSARREGFQRDVCELFFSVLNILRIYLLRFFAVLSVNFHNKLGTPRAWADIDILPMLNSCVSRDFPVLAPETDSSVFRNPPFEKRG